MLGIACVFTINDSPQGGTHFKAHHLILELGVPALGHFIVSEVKDVLDLAYSNLLVERNSSLSFRNPGKLRNTISIFLACHLNAVSRLCRRVTDSILLVVLVFHDSFDCVQVDRLLLFCFSLFCGRVAYVATFSMYETSNQFRFLLIWSISQFLYQVLHTHQVLCLV